MGHWCANVITGAATHDLVAVGCGNIDETCSGLRGDRGGLEFPTNLSGIAVIPARGVGLQVLKEWVTEYYIRRKGGIIHRYTIGPSKAGGGPFELE